MPAVKVDRTENIPPGSRVLVDVEGRFIGVYNSGGSLYAIRSQCPHQGAPLCEGNLTGTLLPSAPGELVYGMKDRVVMCPWHHWEFDVETGRSLFDPKVRVKTYPVRVEDGYVFIDV